MSIKGNLIVALIFVTTSVMKAQHALPDSIVSRFADSEKDSALVLHLNNLATSYLKTNPSLSRSIATYSSELASQVKFTRGYARALTILGNSYWYEGIYEFAQNYYLLAARQYQTIKDSVGLGQVYNNIGEVNKRLQDYPKALSYLTESVNLKKNDSTRALTLYNIGELYLSMGKFKEAQQYVDKSMSLARKAKDERTIAYNYWTIGRIRAQQGLFDESLPYFKDAETLWIKLGETRSLIQTYQDLASAYRIHHQIKQAQEYLDKASALATKINVPDLRIKTYLEYFKVDSTKGDFKKALYYLSRHNTLKDSVYNLLKAEQIARVQTIYETEIRDRENQQLKAEMALHDTQLRSRERFIIVISLGLLIVLLLIWILFRQHRQILKSNRKLQENNREIHDQKEAIEVQAVALLKLNEELQNFNKTLENRIAERTQQLSLQNQRLAEYTFINAHKLRAPVASILGLINLLEQANPSEKETILKHLKTCSDQLDNTIKEISRNLEAAIVQEP
jgi:tetratricopeptide (TPR) repeat protein